MRNILFILIFSFDVWIGNVDAQGVSRMFGLVGGNAQPNQSSNGFLFSSDSTGNNFGVQYNFPVTTFGANPANLEMAPYNGKLYGTTSLGGVHNAGTLFEYNPVTGIYTKKFDFGHNLSVTGGSPKGSLLLYNNKFYGLAADYGANGGGCIFEWDPTSNIYTKKYDFNGTAGANPQNSLRLMNGKMYGTCVSGGSANLGVVFEWDPASNICNKMYELTGPNGWGFYNNVTPYNNRLYAMSHQGGSNGYGAIYMIDPSLPYGTNATIIRQMDANGGTANNNEMIVHNNKLYGCLFNGGGNFSGVLFELNPVGNVYSKLAEFEFTSTGRNPLGKLVANGSKFLGMCNTGGINSTGTVYEWDPANPTVIVKKADFAPNNYDNSVAPSSVLSAFNSKFYATTFSGGFVNQGNLFEYDPATNVLNKRLSFNAAENGRIPFGKPVLLNGKIYGTCYQGPQEIFGTPYGCLWQFDPSTSVYTRRFLFNSENNAANGRGPISSPVAYNGKLYGTTSNGGTSDFGVIYEFDPQTSAYSRASLQSVGGSFPIGEPTLYNNKFYGMTRANGVGNNGIIYSYDPATAVLSKLLDVQGSGSIVPQGGFIVYNNKLYGTTSGGGINNVGGIILYDPATNAASTVASFSTALGVNVANAPTLYNNKLYFTALGGGTQGRGTVMVFDPATNGITKLHDFSTAPGGTGYDPKGGMTVSGDKLYFITDEASNSVNVIELNPATNSLSRKSNYVSNNLNTSIARNGLTVVPAFIANGVGNSCETYPTIVINSSNNNRWVPILNTGGDVVGEIKANGNSLGNVSASMYINNAAVREDGQRHLYMDRSITINVQNPPVSNVDIRLYVKTSEFMALKNATNSLGQASGVTTINDIAIFKNAQACASSFGTISTKLVTTASDYEYGYVLAASINSFSSFYFARNNFTALPVSLLSFNAALKNNTVRLAWATENELNFSKFEVEKSVDASLFSPLTTVAASGRPVINNYEAIDFSPVKGFNYYRLKMIDTDGRFEYSEIVKVKNTDKVSLSLSPNPASHQLIIADATQSDRVVILDATGRVVMSKIIARQNEPIWIEHLSAGVYIIQLHDKGQLLQSRFIKN